MANGTGPSLTPLWLVAGGVVLVLAMMGSIVAIHPLDFSPPKATACEGESCAGHDSAPGERPETSHAAPTGEHEGAPAGEATPPAEHHE